MYDFVLIGFCIPAVLVLPVLLVIFPHWRYGVLQRFGIFSREVSEKLKSGNNIWLHAASAGEVVSLSAIANLLKSVYTENDIVLSTTTKAGQDMANKTMPCIKASFYLPIDIKWIVRYVVKLINPKLLIFAETEYWPNLLKEAKLVGAKVVLVNGRFSEKSLKRYKIVKKPFAKVLKNIDMFNMQSKKDADTVLNFGVSPDKVKILGDAKYDIGENTGKDKIIVDFNCLNHREHIIIAGSVHDGEYEEVLYAFSKIVEKYSDSVLVLAPRHIDKIAKLEESANQFGIPYFKRTNFKCEKVNAKTSGGFIIILDTIGELATLYKIGKIAFVGGSLIHVGGHNVFEPAIAGIPVLFGPYTQNFEVAVTALKEQGGGIEVKDKDDLASTIINLFDNPEEIKRIGKLSRDTANRYTGSAYKNVDLIKKVFQSI
ncbi:MAG: glycosyltransferase N-terminal domain-containing protein [Candidatus Firestonebacteria bacterium]